jgi:hypothetical protein
MQTPPAPGIAPKKKSTSGCLIALAVVGGLGVLVVALAAFGLYRFSTTKEGKMVFGVIGEATKMAAEAQSAPGAAEVRALGCDQGMVMDMNKMGKIFEQLDASAPPSDQLSVMVFCQVGVFAKAPTCDAVAHTYHAAVGSHRGFAAYVTHSGGHGGEVCSSLYDADGKKVRDLPSGSAPKIPGVSK